METKNKCPNMRQQLWGIQSIEKENQLRLNWFKKNEEKLEAYAERENTRKVPEEILQERKNNRRSLVQDAGRKARTKYQDPPPIEIDPESIYKTMKPIEPKIRNVLYGGGQNDGRVSYLKQRVEKKPEDRYYFPECMSFRYGWNMWNYSKEHPMVRYGKSRIVQTSFYRRRGVERDPDWYKEPERLSPSVCQCS